MDALDEPQLDVRMDLVEEFDAVLINVPGEVTPMGDDVNGSFGKYPAKLHARKVAAELESEHGITSGLIYIQGEVTKFFEDSDQSPDFRQLRYFFYMSGADFPDCSLTYDLDNDHLVLWIPYVEPRQVLWNGPTPSPAECLERLDVDEVRYARGIREYLSTRLSIASLPAGTHFHWVFLLHARQHFPIARNSGRGTGRTLFRADLRSLRRCMDAARVVKTDYEVAMIRQANVVSSAAHRKVAEKLKGFKNEREIEVLFRSECALVAAKRQAYPVIAGAGTNASTLHYEANDQPLAGKQLVVVDAGCEWNCYASDITRTLPVSGHFSKEAAEIYSVVSAMQEACIARARPGRLFHDLHREAARIAVQRLKELGILRVAPGDSDEIWEAGTVTAFFPHGLGHHIGLETHDVSGRERLLVKTKRSVGFLVEEPEFAERVGGEVTKRFKREPVTPEVWKASHLGFRPVSDNVRQALRENMVVTIEPGIYFCREYIEGYFLNDPVHSRFIDRDVLEKYYPMGGVRIEDNILITEDGCENLTTAPKGADLLAIINGVAQDEMI